MKRGEYVKDFIFDAVIEQGRKRRPIEVLSFAAARRDWAPIERDAGHFLFALEQLKLEGWAVVQPPTPATYQSAKEPHRRVTKWLKRFDVPIASPEDLAEPQQVLDVLPR